jgi:hypothetical protein
MWVLWIEPGNRRRWWRFRHRKNGFFVATQSIVSFTITSREDPRERRGSAQLLRNYSAQRAIKNSLSGVLRNSKCSQLDRPDIYMARVRNYPVQRVGKCALAYRRVPCITRNGIPAEQQMKLLVTFIKIVHGVVRYANIMHDLITAEPTCAGCDVATRSVLDHCVGEDLKYGNGTVGSAAAALRIGPLRAHRCERCLGLQAEGEEEWKEEYRDSHIRGIEAV